MASRIRSPYNSTLSGVHATYFQSLPPPQNRYVSWFVVGITCEKCHGRDANTCCVKVPRSRISRLSHTESRKFSRDRQIDLLLVPCRPRSCACWSFLLSSRRNRSTNTLNCRSQIRMRRLTCRQPSRVAGKKPLLPVIAMTCLTCHDVHTDQHICQCFRSAV